MKLSTGGVVALIIWEVQTMANTSKNVELHFESASKALLKLRM